MRTRCFKVALVNFNICGIVAFEQEWELSNEKISSSYTIQTYFKRKSSPNTAKFSSENTEIIHKIKFSSSYKKLCT